MASIMPTPVTPAMADKTAGLRSTLINCVVPCTPALKNRYMLFSAPPNSPLRLKLVVPSLARMAAWADDLPDSLAAMKSANLVAFSEAAPRNSRAFSVNLAALYGGSDLICSQTVFPLAPASSISSRRSLLMSSSDRM